MLYLPIEIIQYISNFLDHISQLNFISTSCILRTNINVTNFYVRYLISPKLINNQLKKHIYIKYLNLSNNEHINDLTYLKYIVKLDISGVCTTTQSNINHLVNLVELNISNNINICKLGMFKKLEKLYMRGICNVNIEEINKLPKLKYLNIIFNPKRNEIIKKLKRKNNIKIVL